MTQPEIIPVPARDEQTMYSSPEQCERFATAPARGLNVFVEYVLWECSTEFMVTHGMPTDKDVSLWIEWLEKRIDVADPDIQSAILMCNEYIKPSPVGVAQGE